MSSRFEKIPIELIEIIVSFISVDDYHDFNGYLWKLNILDKINYNTILRYRYPDFYYFIKMDLPKFYIRDCDYYLALDSFSPDRGGEINQLSYGPGGLPWIADKIHEYRYHKRYPLCYQKIKELKLDNNNIYCYFWSEATPSANAISEYKPNLNDDDLTLYQYILLNGGLSKPINASRLTFNLFVKESTKKMVIESCLLFIIIADDNFVIEPIPEYYLISEYFSGIKNRYKSFIYFDVVENILIKKLERLIENENK